MKKETLQNIVYSPLYLWFKLHAILPMRILYILSDILYFPLYYIVHYRRKLVSENLRKAFPDKTDKELKQLEQKFYHHFCDYIVETIKRTGRNHRPSLCRKPLYHYPVRAFR